MEFTPYEQLTSQAAARAIAELSERLPGEDLTPLIPRLAISGDGAVGLVLKRPRLYDPTHSALSPSGQPWIAGDGPAPTQRNWLATEAAFHSIGEALELLRGPPEKNPEIECEKRRREANDSAEIGRRRDESLSREHNARLEANRLLQEERAALGERTWLTTAGWGKLTFRLEAAARKAGLPAFAEEIRRIALEALDDAARYSFDTPQAAHLAGPSMLTEKWMP